MKIIVERTTKKVVKILPQSGGVVKVIAYRKLKRKQIEQYLVENAGWIAQHQLTSPCANTVAGSQTASLSNAQLTDLFVYKSILLCGDVYKVLPSAHTQARLQDDALFIGEKFYDDKNQRMNAVKRFVKKMSDISLSQEVSKFGNDVGLCPTKIQLKLLRGRWCSCVDAENRAIVLDYRLVCLPKELQRYVLAHTFAHFDHKGHGESYLECLDNYCPNYADCKNRLRDFDFLLDVFE